jgi:hypothetical protein
MGFFNLYYFLFFILRIVGVVLIGYISGRTQSAFYLRLGFGTGFSNVSEKVGLKKGITRSSKTSAQHNSRLKTIRKCHDSPMTSVIIL